MPWPVKFLGWGTAAKHIWWWIFTSGSILLCNANLVQAVPVKTLASAKLLPDSWIFNKSGLALCSFVGYNLAILLGPSIERLVLNVGTQRQREWAFPNVLGVACIMIAVNTAINLRALEWKDERAQNKLVSD